MRKYVVPIVALAGIALLSSSANAADLIIKSRAIPVNKAGSLPVIVRNVGNGGSLWGIDAGLTFSSANVAAVDANNAFTGTNGYDAAKDVVVTGVPSVGGGTQPNLYFGYVKGGAGISAGTAAQAGVGLVKLKVTAGTARDVYDISVGNYNVKNDGTGNAVSRPGATAATVNGTTVAAESVTLVDALNATSTAVPFHKVAVGNPGDVSGNGAVDGPDVTGLKQIIGGLAGANTPYRLIAGDVAPGNGYTAASPGGTNGLGYGDGVISGTDVTALKQKIGGTANNFPVAE